MISQGMLNRLNSKKQRDVVTVKLFLNSSKRGTAEAAVSLGASARGSRERSGVIFPVNE